MYFIREINTKRVKIGYAANPQNRRATFQINNPNVLVIDFVHPTLAAKDLESQLHQDFKSSTIRGEWYSLEINVDYQNIIKNAENKLAKRYPNWEFVVAQTAGWQAAAATAQATLFNNHAAQRISQPL